MRLKTMNTLRKIILAVEKFKRDIVEYPIYFKVKDIEYLETQVALENIAKKLEDLNYKPDHATKIFLFKH